MMSWGNETKRTRNLPKTLNCVSNCSKVSVISWVPVSKLFNLMVLKEKKKKALSGYPINTGILKSSNEVAWSRVEKKVKILIYFPHLSNTLGAKSFQHVYQSLILDFFGCILFLKSLLNLLQYHFCFMLWIFGHRHVGSYLPYQGSNLHPLHWNTKSQPPNYQESSLDSSYMHTI